MARALRMLIQQYPRDRNAGLDAVLRLLDPRISDPQIQIHPTTVDFGIAETRQYVHITNTGRTYVQIRFVGPDWITCNPTSIALYPGEKIEISMLIHRKQLPTAGALNGAIQVRMGANALGRVRIEAKELWWRQELWQLELWWQELWWRRPHIVVLAVFNIILLILLLIFIYL